jgi:hypothetical protein
MPPPNSEPQISTPADKGGKFSFTFKAKTTPTPAPKPVPDLAPRTSPSLSPGLIVGIGSGTAVVIEVAIRETVGISGISEISETSMVDLGIAETTASLRIVESDGNMTVASTPGKIVGKSHLLSLHEMCRRGAKRFSLVSSPVRRYRRNSQMLIPFTIGSRAMSLSLAPVHTAKCSKAFMSTLNARLRSRRFEWKARKMASP